MIEFSIANLIFGLVKGGLSALIFYLSFSFLIKKVDFFKRGNNLHTSKTIRNGLTLIILVFTLLSTLQTYGPKIAIDTGPTRTYTPEVTEIPRTETNLVERPESRMGRFSQEFAERINGEEK